MLPLRTAEAKTQQQQERVEVGVWDETLPALHSGAAAAEWVSAVANWRAPAATEASSTDDAAAAPAAASSSSSRSKTKPF